MAQLFLNLATKDYAEDRRAGLLICGINWGGPEDSTKLTRHEFGQSFFSDARYVGGPSPYRRRILRWFELFGHPLAGTEEVAGPFERSIHQTNWLSDQSPSMRGKNTYDRCVHGWDNFAFHMTELNPRLVLFMGVVQLDALNSPALATRVRSILGQSDGPTWERREVLVDGRARKRFRVGFQEFDRAQVIAFPHPSGTPGLSDDYIAAFVDTISPQLTRFKIDRKFDLSKDP